MMQKKALVVFPPQWCPYNPYPSVPTLLGCLKKAGYRAEGLDLNISFFNHLLSENTLSSAIRRAYASGDASLPDPAYAQKLCENIGGTLAVFRNEDLFYRPELLFKAKADLNMALELISFSFAPSRLMLTDYFHRVELNDFEIIKKEVANPDNNIFYSFLKEEAGKIAAGGADYVLVSVADVTQILAAFTLCGFLKEFCDKPVCIGGNIITKLKRAFLKEADVFDGFIDYAACGVGELSTVAFAQYMNGELAVENVPGLIYRTADGAIASNPESPAAFPYPVLPDYSGFDFKSYLSPAPDCSLQLSYGCYWGKCAFCDVSYNREQYKPKPVETAIEEIEHLVSLGIRHIHLGDSSVSPAYFNRLCDCLIERDVKVFIFAFARLETAFTETLLKKMYRAGVRLIFWGYESESKRVMSLINKGIDENSRLRILRMSADAGIWNHVSFMMGFPGETKDEALATLKVIEENRDILDSCFLARFSFKSNAKIHEDTQKYSLQEVCEKGDFSTECRYLSEGMTREEIGSISKAFRRKYLQENLDTLWPMVCDDLEHLLFYLSRFGREGVRAIRLKDTSNAINLYKKFL